MARDPHYGRYLRLAVEAVVAADRAMLFGAESDAVEAHLKRANDFRAKAFQLHKNPVTICDARSTPSLPTALAADGLFDFR